MRVPPAPSLLAVLSLLLLGCSDGPALSLTVVTFNTGTTESMGRDDAPDGYTTEKAMYSDLYYGDGMAWLPAVEAARAFFAEVQPDVVAFQEIFHSADCPMVPAEARAGFVCETWSADQPTVAQVVLGEGYQVACNLGKPDKCLAVRREMGSFRGCSGDLCLDGLDGGRVEGCGSGSRVGRGLIELADGTTLTVVNVHGSSGFTAEDMACRTQQFEQVFVDLRDGTGQPAANGERNLVMGDLNTDPGRAARLDSSAERFGDFAGEERSFHFITDVGPDAPGTYAGFNIDHVVSDALRGECWAAGVTEGHPPVYEPRYFDHRPIVCEVRGR